ncbi:WD domain-containing protein [Hirsutella rhossiliensis]|uniref:WD domain-containing protein n=1 Tax=Hirsutella rhossiliensis TaxID=111463 RepID=A0A9P8SIP3_9HYPO|nr:WD domain-containing protein [Hirsutella rhossiliensis]KAH0964428.1 WD domain-containing protein [Hirsutella rhossiliensis]
MPPSPRTPRHSRNSSALDSFQDSPHARRQSKTSLHDSVSAPFISNLNHQDALDLSMLASGGAGSGECMGNLADELADAFSESGEEENDEYQDGDFALTDSRAPHTQRVAIEATRDNGVDVYGEPMSEDIRAAEGGLSIPALPKRGHQRKGSEYDGSEYGSESDLDSAGMPPTLVAKIDAIESLARRGTENYGGPADDVVKRVTDGLRDLGSQSTVEGSASRLITAHSALTTHLAHQTRQLHSLTFPLLSPLATPPDAEAIESLLPLLVALSDDMPRPSTSAFNSLTALHSITSELIQTLSYLSDTLHMSRQTTATASRRLKSARELVSEMRREEELREEGEMWLTRGNWGERLQKRECAGVCGDVIGGFEDVCNGWRQRLLARAESQA